jgi:hypothetical protein
VIGTTFTLSGPAPIVATTLTWRDRLGTARVRSSIGRNDYRVDPGLYAVGEPDDRSPVLVSANYKLSFDTVRAALAGRDAWLLVLDTRGVNVWCAAGKGTFGTDEIVRQIGCAMLTQVVSHRVVVLPQLGAPGVSAPHVRRRTGFRAVWGPVRASDLPAFLDAEMRATPDMRRVTFSLRDRLVLIPVEMMAVLGIMLAILAANTVVAGLSARGFSIADALSSIGPTLAVVLTAAIAGTIVTPLLLPWIPGRMFSVRGALVGAVGAAIVLPLVAGAFHPLRLAAAAILIVAGSSYMAMNFTGATTFTSLSGVLKEMKASLPWQVGGAGTALALWIARVFVR